MSLTLLSSTFCKQCQQYFASSYALIAHFEIIHLPDVIAAERRREEQGPAVARASLPLSYYCRVFPEDEPAPQPVAPPLRTKLPFLFNRKRNIQGHLTEMYQMPVVGRRTEDAQNYTEDEDSNMSEIDLDEADPSDPNISVRYKCQIPSCGKQYKNVHGVRHHMLSTHGDQRNPQQVIVHPEHIPANKNGRPFKCPHCSKRYKSPQGLSQHLSKEHMRMDNGGSGSISAPMSPTPILEQKLAQGMRPIASQPHLMGMAQGNHQMRQLPVGNMEMQGQGTYHQIPEYQADQPTGAVLQARLQRPTVCAKFILKRVLVSIWTS
ncbi:unnamed protein product, partial [Mesorhabditis spiculigera]